GPSGTRTRDLRIKSASVPSTSTGTYDDRGLGGDFAVSDIAQRFLARVAEAPEGTDGELLAVAFAEEVDAALSPVIASAAQVSTGGTFALRRAIALAHQLLERG